MTFGGGCQTERPPLNGIHGDQSVQESEEDPIRMAVTRGQRIENLRRHEREIPPAQIGERQMERSAGPRLPHDCQDSIPIQRVTVFLNEQRGIEDWINTARWAEFFCPSCGG